MRTVLAAIVLTMSLTGTALAADKLALQVPAHKPVTVINAGDPLAASMAPSLLKSKTQYRILKHDDEQAAGCGQKSFAAAKIITQPIDAGHGQRKWQEQWVLDRCGTAVGYRVFFTDVGDGGAFFAFTQTN